MRRQLVQIEYPVHGTGITLPRTVLVIEMYEDRFVGVDIGEYSKTRNVSESYRTFKISKIPHRGMTTISFPNLNKRIDFPYPRTSKLNKIVTGLRRDHKSLAR